jgi:prefoldin subunit 5
LDEPKKFGALFAGSESETRGVLAETTSQISRLVSECEALHADKLSLQQEIQQAKRKANSLRVIARRLTSHTSN